MLQAVLVLVLAIALAMVKVPVSLPQLLMLAELISDGIHIV